MEAAETRDIALDTASEFDSPVGKGVVGTFNAKRLVIGSLRIMAEEGVDVSTLAAEAELPRGEGATVIFMSVDGKLGGLIAIADPVK